jgi:hypothetical protein
MSTLVATLADSPGPSFELSADRFASHLSANAVRFFPELNHRTTKVRTLRSAIRRKTSLFEFEASDGELRKQVIYKIACTLDESTRKSPAENRPRLFPSLDPAGSGLREFRALKSIEHHFAELQDDRFGSIKVLELLESPYVIAMEKCADVSLKAMLKKSTRFHNRTDTGAMNSAIVNAGAWLREFHQIPELAHTKSRHADRLGFGDAVQLFTDVLIQTPGNALFFQSIREKMDTVALRALPRELPCATAHGDFAPRNILVGENARVTGLDTQRRWKSPIYEDLAYFLMSVKLPALQVRSQGSLFSQRQLNHWENVPTVAVRLYELLLTLEWWAAINCRSQNGFWFSRMGLRLSNRYLFRHVGRLVDQLEAM